MEENDMNLLDTMPDNVVVSVFAQKDKLLAQTKVQDVKVANLWKAYSSTGLTYPQYSNKLVDPLRKKMVEIQSETPFFEQYEQTNKALEKLTGQLKEKDNSIEKLTQSEQLINDLLILLNFQWNLLVGKLSLVVKQAESIKVTEKALMDEYKERMPGLEKHRLGLTIIEGYGMQYQQLIADQIQLFLEEGEIMDQMQEVCDKRERLFNLSTELILR